MPTILENLLTEHNVLLQKIIDQAKLDALQSRNTPTPTPPPTIVEDLSSQINTTFNNLIKDKKDKNIMTPYVNPYNWPRNNNSWVRSLDLTGYAACIVPLGGVGGGTLITKKHVLLANHVPYSPSPFMIFFVNNNNVSLVYNVVKTRRVSNTDILIGELDREVDASLKVYSILPSNYLKYIDKNVPLPVLHSDQERKALIAIHGSVENVSNATCVTITRPTDANRLQYYEEVIGGDSGNPVFTIINNEAVLLGGWYMKWTNAGVATLLPNYISDINSTIAALSSGYKITEADLSSYKTY
jgi:hypothetical protein